MKTKTLLLTSSFVVGMAMSAFAHDGVMGIIKERMDGMKAMGKAMGSVADMFKGKTEFDAGQVGTAADIVLQHSANIDKLFPDTEASRNGKGTEVLPAVWEDRDGFMALVDELEKRATDLKQVAAGGDQNAIRASFGSLAKSCSSCHEDYRKAKE